MTWDWQWILWIAVLAIFFVVMMRGCGMMGSMGGRGTGGCGMGGRRTAESGTDVDRQRPSQSDPDQKQTRPGGKERDDPSRPSSM